MILAVMMVMTISANAMSYKEAKKEANNQVAQNNNHSNSSRHFGRR